jgi:CRP-like cAMP-binding protein
MAADPRTVKLYEGLSDKELKDIARELREVRHPAGKEVIVAGDGGVGFMSVVEGRLKVTLPDGREREIGPGDSFGEMALLDHQGRSATITAETDVTLLCIPEWNFKSFLELHPEVSWRLLQTLSRRVRQAESGT